MLFNFKMAHQIWLKGKIVSERNLSAFLKIEIVLLLYDLLMIRVNCRIWPKWEKMIWDPSLRNLFKNFEGKFSIRRRQNFLKENLAPLPCLLSCVNIFVTLLIKVDFQKLKVTGIWFARPKWLVSRKVIYFFIAGCYGEFDKVLDFYSKKKTK